MNCPIIDAKDLGEKNEPDGSSLLSLFAGRVILIVTKMGKVTNKSSYSI